MHFADYASYQSAIFGHAERADRCYNKRFDENGTRQVRNARHNSRPSARYFR